MDLSPKLLTDVQFREQWRGYNPDEVDEFLERVAAGVEELQQRLTDALERASNAERRLLERSLTYAAVAAFLSAGFLFGVMTLMGAGTPLLTEYRVGALFLVCMAALAFELLRPQLLE